MQDITDRFSVKSEDGVTYQALELCERLQIATSETSNAFVHGPREYRLIDGRQLNLVDDKTFTIANTTRHVTRR